MKTVCATYRCVRVERDPPEARMLGLAARVELEADANPSHPARWAFGRIYHLVFDPVAADEFREGAEYEVTFTRLAT